MDSVIALVGKDFVLSAADTANARSVIVMKDDVDKILELDSHKTLAMGGEPGDFVQFTEYIQKNLHLYEFQTGLQLSTHAVANFIRGELARLIRYCSFVGSLNMHQRTVLGKPPY
jgi:20S proteasome subunit beta 4